MAISRKEIEKMRLKEEIKKIREEKGFSQRELADKAGLSYSFVNDIENGRRTPSLESVEAIAEALGVSVVTLLGGDAISDSIPPEMEEDIETLHKNPELKTLLRLGKKATKRDLDFIIEFLKKGEND